MNTALLVDDSPRMETRPPARRAAWPVLLTGGIALLLAWSVVARVYHLDRLPGINGDEAWSGVQAVRLVRGEPIAWRTPTGNPVNAWYLFPLAALHLVFAPSFTLLRAVAVVSGLVAIAVNYWLCRRVFDRTTTIVTTLLVALLPINVAYSRFGWDTSQSLLACLFVLYWPLLRLKSVFPRRISVAGLVALGVAIWVHPTNVFAAPLVVMPWLYANRTRCWQTLHATHLPQRPLTLAALALGAVGIAYAGFRLLAGVDLAARGPDEFVNFLRSYVQLFSGSTVYQFIAGTHLASEGRAWYRAIGPISDIVLAGAVAWSAWGWKQRLAERTHSLDTALLAGWSAMLLGFFLVAGPRAVAPHFERYAICLVAPGSLVLARGLTYWLEPGRGHVQLCRRLLLALAACWPVAFSLGYLQYLEQTGGSSHRAFRTADREPKQQAFDLVLHERKPGATLRIETDDWWTYWPLAYLALGEQGVEVVCQQVDGAHAGKEHDGTSAWRIGFVDPAETSDIACEQNVSPAVGGPAQESRWIFAADGTKLLRISRAAE